MNENEKGCKHIVLIIIYSVEYLFVPLLVNPHNPTSKPQKTAPMTLSLHRTIQMHTQAIKTPQNHIYVQINSIPIIKSRPNKQNTTQLSCFYPNQLNPAKFWTSAPSKRHSYPHNKINYDVFIVGVRVKKSLIRIFKLSGARNRYFYMHQWYTDIYSGEFNKY